MDSAADLFEIAETAAEALAQIKSDEIQKPLAAIEREAEVAKRAWSGSNIGYHANVYFGGLRPKTPDAEFSPEWGLMDVWPTHQPHRMWEKMDPETVRSTILDRAGNPDLGAIQKKLEKISDAFSAAREKAISVLIVATADLEDAFLAKKLEIIEGLNLFRAPDIALSLVPKGSRLWSRDSLAMTQGLQVAPHQRLIGEYLAATVLKNGLDTLHKATLEAASHLKRLSARGAKAAMIGTNVFIGHGRSPIWRELSAFIEKRIGLPVDEFNSVPVAGISTTARLSELLDAAAFAFLIMTAEDEQSDGTLRARENVVHEVGLFQGRLGFTRAIVLLEEGCQEFSNIHGVGQLRFPRGNISAKFEDIRAVLEREGLIS